jgi:Protein of unknown function (DUF2628)
MAIYAVHSPALGDDPAKAFDRARTLRQGYARWGLVFGPLWLLFKGLWLALAAWVVGAALVEFAISKGVLSSDAGLALYALSAVFIGLEGRHLQGHALTRSGRPLADIVVGANALEAERDFLARTLITPTPVVAAPRVNPPPSSGDSHILGLFPEAQR